MLDDFNWRYTNLVGVEGIEISATVIFFFMLKHDTSKQLVHLRKTTVLKLFYVNITILYLIEIKNVYIDNTYIHTCIHTYKHTYIHTYTHIHIYIYIYIHTFIHTHTHTHTHIYIYIYIYLYIYIHTYISTSVHTFIYICTWKKKEISIGRCSNMYVYAGDIVLLSKAIKNIYSS